LTRLEARLLERFVGKFFIGVDLGKQQDYSVISVMKKEGKTVKLVHLKRFPLKTPYATVLGYLQILCRKLRYVEKIYIDRTGVGDYIVEEAKRIGLPNVEGINFTIRSKEDMAVSFKQAMLTGKIRLPYNRELATGLNVERFTLTPDGHYKFSHPKNAHDDIFWSVILAYVASRGDVSEIKRGEGFKW
jgi:phage FluMu gp28-like protein